MWWICCTLAEQVPTAKYRNKHGARIPRKWKERREDLQESNTFARNASVFNCFFIVFVSGGNCAVTTWAQQPIKGGVEKSHQLQNESLHFASVSSLVKPKQKQHRTAAKRNSSRTTLLFAESKTDWTIKLRSIHNGYTFATLLSRSFAYSAVCGTSLTAVS